LRLCASHRFSGSVIQHSTENLKYVWLGFVFDSWHFEFFLKRYYVRFPGP
jgi:hypothetical protein